MKKETLDKFKPFFLPVVTLVIVFALFTFYIPGNKNNNLITGLFAREQNYELNASIELNNLNFERDSNCTIVIKVLSEKKEIIQNYSLGIDNFVKKDNNYAFDLSSLKIYLNPGKYFLDVIVYCDDEKISESEKEITV
jgi:hypothetical protein